MRKVKLTWNEVLTWHRKTRGSGVKFRLFFKCHRKRQITWKQTQICLQNSETTCIVWIAVLRGASLFLDLEPEASRQPTGAQLPACPWQRPAGNATIPPPTANSWSLFLSLSPSAESRQHCLRLLSRVVYGAPYYTLSDFESLIPRRNKGGIR